MDLPDWSQLDWIAKGPWLAMLLLLVSGVALPVLVYGLFDRWASRRLKLDTVALATRYGGFMNSWAVFGRHAGEYRDVRPLFPGAQAAELARFHDNTATIAARFRSPEAAAEAAEQRFGSFASAGVEYADAGIAFRAGGKDRQGRSPYRRGQWLLLGDTLFAFYAADSRSLAQRRQATPALRARRFPGPLRLLHNRAGHFILVLLWVTAHLGAASLILERSAYRPATGEPVDAAELHGRLAAHERRPESLQIMQLENGDLLTTRMDDARHFDLDLLAGRIWKTGLRLEFDVRRRRVIALPLVGQAEEVKSRAAGTAPTARWHNNSMLIDPDDPLLEIVSTAVRDSGWEWRPAIWPLPGQWRTARPF